jgi:transcription elongation factor Elf1
MIAQTSNWPACPDCGCQSSTIDTAGMRHGTPWATFTCDLCEAEFATGELPRTEPVVRFVALRCPYCDSRDCSADAVDFRTRRHKCRDCGKSFTSIEA